MTYQPFLARSLNQVATLVFALVLCSAIASAQSGLPFSSVPTGGMGNPPGVTFPSSGTVPVTIAHPGPHRIVRPIVPGAVPIFFGADEPGTVVINNIVPVPEAPVKTPTIEEQPAAAPLIIERQGDRWVRRHLTSTAPARQGAPTESENQLLPTHAPQLLPDITLVFRDGHREDVTTYMIFAGSLYHSTPAWAPQQQVRLSSLDLPATESINRERGLVFRIPNSPNEVVTRP